VDLKDATLMFLVEAAAHPAVATTARSAHDQLVDGDGIDYRILDKLIGEASGKGVLRAIARKYGPTAYEAMIGPILHEIGRQKPIQSRWQPSTRPGSDDDPLTARVWPPRSQANTAGSVAG
jgi:hypothetical protein